MFRLLLIACIALGPATASATFELEDPAKKIMEEEKEEEMTLGDMRCARFVRHRENYSDSYFASLKWLIRRLDDIAPGWADSTSPDAMTRWIDDYCRENPEQSLTAATSAFLQ